MSPSDDLTGDAAALPRIRTATTDDAAAIAAIWNPIIRDTAITFWPAERPAAEIAAMIAARQRDGHAFLVAEADWRLLAFGTYAQFRSGAGYARSLEHSIHAAPGARGRGVGRALLTALEQHARDAGGRIMIGAITASNAGSIAFHDRMGYGVWGRIPRAGWKFGQFHDLVLMGKDLG
ncbi:GNAT family N-acetyltransferase [Paracoccus luteus]|uniref:GNAT family N-acetyltransferase n=1 Tax=Paracoccus luteus TaxID=2508543 RepID=UPI0010701381|nr:GNAT family N-acetyltransferase [Paracoccus luteus]